MIYDMSSSFCDARAATGLALIEGNKVFEEPQLGQGGRKHEVYVLCIVPGARCPMEEIVCTRSVWAGDEFDKPPRVSSLD